MPQAKYEIRFSRARQMRGLNAYGLFEVVDEHFLRGISDHKTEEDAEAAKAALEKGAE